MNQKEALVLKNDRDYWKTLCSELSNNNVEKEENLIQLQKIFRLNSH